MGRETEDKKKILIADDSEINRAILTDILADEFEILEAENGMQAITILNQLGTNIAVILLDAAMPVMDGYEVLRTMRKQGWLEDVPVIMISAESRPAYIEEAYELGISDFIARPFDEVVVHRRVLNTIMLYTKQNKLAAMVAEQIYEREKSSDIMISILGHIVEFRNGESGLHVLHIRTITELLLRHLVQMTDRYQLSTQDISRIATASALHDIGKIGIPDEILNKPGKLTPEEFEVMKTHSMLGASMLQKLEMYQDEPLVRTAYEICRWHHERYDGRGYPDGLRGEEIPISAQIVALADVYDALTSPRVYKPAFSHEEAMGMILRGESGTFNPLLLTCLKENADNIKRELAYNVPGENGPLRTRRLIDEVLQHEELSAPQRTLRLLEREQSKYHFFADMSHEILFEYTCTPPMLTLSEWGAEHLGLEETVMEPLKDGRILRLISKEDLAELGEALHAATAEQPVIQQDCQLVINGEPRWYRVICRVTWGEEPSQYIGAIGKAVDIHDEHMDMMKLRHKASHDSLTGLWNHGYAREYIVRQLQNAPESKYAVMLVDLDNFKEANDQHGHIFGDGVLRHTADKLRHSVRSGDIVARIGGDEFLIFLEYTTDIRGTAERIFQSLSGSYAEFEIRVSVGVALSEQNGNDYDTLLHCADRALYAAKRSGRGDYCFYNASMRDMFSTLFPTGGEAAKEQQDGGAQDKAPQ